MPSEILNNIGYILMRAGSDNGFIILNRRDTLALGLLDKGWGKKLGLDEEITVMVHPSRMESQVREKMPDPTPREELVEAVEPILLNAEQTGEQVIRSYNVHVGTARKALDIKLGGRSLDNLRQPDPPMPITQEEPANT